MALVGEYAICMNAKCEICVAGRLQQITRHGLATITNSDARVFKEL
jgi:hypothetical protein